MSKDNLELCSSLKPLSASVCELQNYAVERYPHVRGMRAVLDPGSLAEAGSLRGLAAEVRDRGAALDPEGSAGEGRAYWPEVARLLLESYRSLSAALAQPDPGQP